MSRRGADEVSGSPQLQARLLRPAGPAQMNAADRDRLIVALNGKGWDHSRIARATGMTRRGVGMALARISEGQPGRVRRVERLSREDFRGHILATIAHRIVCLSVSDWHVFRHHSAGIELLG